MVNHLTYRTGFLRSHPSHNHTAALRNSVLQALVSPQHAWLERLERGGQPEPGCIPSPVSPHGRTRRPRSILQVQAALRLCCSQAPIPPLSLLPVLVLLTRTNGDCWHLSIFNPFLPNAFIYLPSISSTNTYEGHSCWGQIEKDAMFIKCEGEAIFDYVKRNVKQHDGIVWNDGTRHQRTGKRT